MRAESRAAAEVVLPLAPYWGFSADMKWRVWAWLGALLLYTVAIGLA